MCAGFRCFCIVFLLLFSLPRHVSAEQTLADAEWFERPIGAGVVWKHYQFENLYGRRQSVSVVEADLGNPLVKVKFPYLAATRGKTSVITPAQYPDALAAINGTYFDTSAGGGGSTTFLRINNTIITPANAGMGTDGGLTLSSTDRVRIQPQPTGGWDAYITRRDVMACGPLLISAGTLRSMTPFGAHCSNRHPRTAVGVTDNLTGLSRKIYLVTVDGRTDQAAGMTCDELARLMAELGCGEALNMDGGGSTTMWVAGEPYGGVVNYPSDNGEYDHLGERSCANAIAVVSGPVPPRQYDARLFSVNYQKLMVSNTTQTATIVYKNIGSQTWPANTASFVVTRPRTRSSEFYTTGSWMSQTTVTTALANTVAADEFATFSVVLSAPLVTSGREISENFGLWLEDVGPVGPADNEPRLEIAVEPPSSQVTGTIIIESRSGGQNFTRYSESGGWADISATCGAEGLTPGLGGRYGSTYRSVAGTKIATFKPNITQGGTYKVSIAYPIVNLAKTTIQYKVVHADGTDTFIRDQTLNRNMWLELGTFRFDIGVTGWVNVSNEAIDVSGNMTSGVVKFEAVNVPVAVSGWVVE